MSKKKQKYYIKERDNHQSRRYFVAKGQLTKAAATRVKDTLYGINIMHAFDSEEAYLKRLEELKQAGERVQ